ncbi:MAG: hypothetical protein HY895_00365 [Deltaproteobacteria bacterium]|nr:hypothetical protein [Deltaproteobacteria bacterium]
MTNRFAKQLCTVILAPVAALSACAWDAPHSRSTAWSDFSEAQVAVSATEFSACIPVRQNYADSWQAEQYALFQVGGRQLEVVYARANPAITVALDYPMPIEKMASTWALSSGQRLVWGPLERMDHPLGILFFRPYDLGEARRPCFGFLVEWDQIYADPQGRPGKVLFGYYCGETSDVLGYAEIRTIIRGITICADAGCQNPENRNGSTPSLMQRPGTAAAVAGGHPKTSGNPGFPFRFARFYKENGKGQIR